MQISRARYKPFSFFGNNKLSYSIQALTNQMSKQNKEWKRTAGVGIQHYTPHLFTVNRPTADPGIVTFSWQQTTSLAQIKKLKSRELLKLVEKKKKNLIWCWNAESHNSMNTMREFLLWAVESSSGLVSHYKYDTWNLLSHLWVTIGILSHLFFI